MPRLVFSVLTVVLFVTPAGLFAGDLPQTRWEFYEAFRKLKIGDSQEKVLQIMGEPHDVVMGIELPQHGGMASPHSEMYWRYGTSGHLTLAILGEISFDTEGKVDGFCGRRQPIPTGLIEEHELRKLLQALDEVDEPGPAGGRNPLKLIRAVNLLQPLGKEKALWVMREYLRLTLSDRYRYRDFSVWYVSRTLFEVPEKRKEMPIIGVSDLDSLDPELRRLILPRYPIHLLDDVPYELFVYFLWDSSGGEDNPDQHLKFFRRKAQIRTELLRPGNNPVKSVNSFMTSPLWFFRELEHGAERDEYLRISVKAQVLNLLSTVVPLRDEATGKHISEFEGNELEPKIQQIYANLGELKIRWDAEQSRYTFLDGTTLPQTPRKQPSDACQTWKPDVEGRDINLFFRNVYSRQRLICLREKYDNLVPRELPSYEVFWRRPPKGTFAPLECEVSSRLGFDDERTLYRSISCQADIPEDIELQIKLTVGDKTYTSPVFKP